MTVQTFQPEEGKGTLAESAPWIDALGTNVKQQLERIVTVGDEACRLWAVVDLVLAVLRGAVRVGLLTHPR